MLLLTEDSCTLTYTETGNILELKITKRIRAFWISSSEENEYILSYYHKIFVELHENTSDRLLFINDLITLIDQTSNIQLQNTKIQMK